MEEPEAEKVESGQMGAPITIQSQTEEEGIVRVTVVSGEINDTFVLDIITPQGYDPNKQYPVLYITDGNWRRAEYEELKALQRDKRVRDLIMVGICYPDSYDLDTIRIRDLIEEPDTFLSFLVTGIIPYVNENYSTDTSNQTLWGASFGGYFTLYSLLQSDGITKGVFRNYISSSPTFLQETHGKTLFDYEQELYGKTAELDCNVYMAVGELEEQYEFLVPFGSFEEQLQSRNYKGLTYASKIYEKEDHYTVTKPAFFDGLTRHLAPETK